jgi:hypothetical protein
MWIESNIVVIRNKLHHIWCHNNEKCFGSYWYIYAKSDEIVVRARNASVYRYYNADYSLVDSSKMLTIVVYQGSITNKSSFKLSFALLDGQSLDTSLTIVDGLPIRTYPMIDWEYRHMNSYFPANLQRPKIDDYWGGDCCKWFDMSLLYRNYCWKLLNFHFISYMPLPPFVQLFILHKFF